MQEEQVILVNEKDEPIGLCPKMEAHEKALLHRAFSVFIFNKNGLLLLQQRAAHKYHSPRLWTNTVCSHQRNGESNLAAGKRRLQEEMGMQAPLQEVFHFIYKAEFDNGLTEHELDHVLIGFSDENPDINKDEVMNYRWESLDQIAKDIAQHPEEYTEWFKIIFQNSLPKLKEKLAQHFLQQPIRFQPIYKEKPWGGDKLKTVLGKKIPSNKTGESWEISAVPKNISRVSSGYFKGLDLQDLLQQFQEKITGKKVWRQFGSNFPLLIKFIDAADDLSIQVHPDDQMAKSQHNSYGKNELWYIIQADPGVVLYIGFKPDIDKEKYLQKLQEGKLEEILNKVEAKSGDIFYIPAGTVHAIGKGVLLAEVQQTSDLTYRIYDWNRTGLNGKPRSLHTERALQAIDFAAKPQKKKAGMVKTPYFEFEKMRVEKNVNIDLTNLDSFVILMGVKGKYKINGQLLKKGETILIPAVSKNMTIETIESGTLLKVQV